MAKVTGDPGIFIVLIKILWPGEGIKLNFDLPGLLFMI